MRHGIAGKLRRKMAFRRLFASSAPDSLWSKRGKSPLKKSESSGNVRGEKVERDVIDRSSSQSEELTSGRGRKLNLRVSRAESAPM